MRIWWPGFHKVFERETDRAGQDFHYLEAAVSEGKNGPEMVVCFSNNGWDKLTSGLKDMELSPLDEECESPMAILAARPGDADKILYFIGQLAEYENRLSEVKITVSQIDEWLFRRNAAEVIFLMREGSEIGFALFYPTFSSFQGLGGLYIEDLFVLPKYRGLGAGTAMVTALSGIALERGCGRLLWECLKRNQLGLGFYRSLKAEVLTDWIPYHLPKRRLLELADLDET
jgi:GNAT superfamily N-acetyltransferase